MKENFEPIVMNQTDYQALVEPYYAQARAALEEFISYPSVLDKATITKEHPFGDGVESALAYVARLGKKLGFTVDRCDNYLTELTYGEGEKILDIYAHADVVPVSLANWKHNPFRLAEEDDVFYGRGTNDDKGPGMACLFATKALMDAGRLGGYKLRFLFGGNEENDSLCLHHYFHEINRGYPTLGFSPDAEYPLIYAEKSIYAFRVDYALNFDAIEAFRWGDALNIVLEDAAVTLKDTEGVQDALNAYLERNPMIKAHLEGNVLAFKGVASHGSLPWNGVNAGLHLLNFLGGFYGVAILEKIFDDFNDGRGEAFGGNFRDKYFSETSYNVGRFAFDGRTLSLFVNFRFPSTMAIGDVLPTVENGLCAKVTLLGGSEGFVADPESDFIRILMNAYQSETGDMKSRPLAIGGGTYARESKNSVAFGAAFVGRDMRMHGNDEYFPVADFYANMAIYADAIDKISDYLRTGKKPF